MRRAVAARDEERRLWTGMISVAIAGLLLGALVLAFRHVFARVPGRLVARVALTELAFTAVVPAGGAGGSRPAPGSQRTARR